LGLLSGHGWIPPALAGQWRVHSKVVNLKSDRCGVGIKGIKDSVSFRIDPAHQSLCTR
jgi:hypothetical protein